MNCITTDDHHVNNEVMNKDAIDYEIDHFINTINEFENSISNKALLIEGLKELQGLVELKNIKLAIILQIKSLIISGRRDMMQNTVITGKPGTGKTTVAFIVGKILLSLGLIEHCPQLKRTDEESLKNDIIKLKELTLGFRNEITVENYPTITHEKTLLQTVGDDVDVLLNVISRIQKNHFTLSSPGVVAVPKITVATRETLISKYLGDTAVMTKKVLDSAKGGVLIIDEAYSLCYRGDGSDDRFGQECLTVINEYMSNNKNSIIVIFLGYKDKLENTIFKEQPGLKRRCPWIFNIEEYSTTGLNEIFRRKLLSFGYTISDTHKSLKIIKDNIMYLKDAAGSMETLSFHSILFYGEDKYNQKIDNLKEKTRMMILHDPNTSSFINDMIITENHILSAIKKMKESYSDEDNEDSFKRSAMMYT